MEKIKLYAKTILVPVIVGGIVGFIISKSIDYNNLQKPFLAPPSIAFPIVWTILYILMGISYGILKSKKLTSKEIDVIYYLQLGFNAIWSIFFFSLKWRLFAFLWIIILAILILNINANVNFIIFKSNTIGFSNPNSSPNDSHHNQSTCEAKFPNNPPITSPDKININNTHIFLSFVAIFLSTFFYFLKYFIR